MRLRRVMGLVLVLGVIGALAVVAARRASERDATVVIGRLMWTVRDNGRDVDWHQAQAYCDACEAGGYRDWRMPTWQELEGLNDFHRVSPRLQGEGDVHITAPFRLSAPWVWSRTLEYDGSAFGYMFDAPPGLAPKSRDRSERQGCRVLCVRSTGIVGP